MNTDTLDTADRLHTGLIDLLLTRGTVTSGRIEAALRAVPRHLFVPDTPLDAAYAPDDAVVTKWDIDGVALSSASAPGVIASMLEQLDVQPGDRILEIGAGTGYNAALLAELAGPAGHVVTIDIDQDVVDGARAALASSGYRQVEVLCADGAQGHAPAGPYDRIIVTAGAWDLPPAWWEQLAPAGRLIVPLRIIGGTSRSIAFDRHDDHLVSRSMATCGFLAMRGIGAQPEPAIALADGVKLLLGDGRTAPQEALARALTQPAARSWSGIVIRSGRPFTDLVTPAFRWAGAAVTNETDSFAYLTIRPAEPAELGDGPVFELGGRAHGPHRDDLTTSLLEQIQHWDNEYRDTTPRIAAHLKPSQVTAMTVIDKPHTLLAVTW